LRYRRYVDRERKRSGAWRDVKAAGIDGSAILRVHGPIYAGIAGRSGDGCGELPIRTGADLIWK
jgi:hypothetical protein